ncbi:MAG: TIGR01777 family oxidoreductase [Armatimonadota bacterium]
MRKLVLPGGGGYLGAFLVRHFVERGWEVVVLSRRPERVTGARGVYWDGGTVGEWARELEGAAAVMNLAGRSVNCRYHAPNRREIYESRLRSTAAVGAAIAACAEPPPVWINSSSATIYRHALDRPMDETTGEIGTGFSVDVCLRWERALADAPTPGTRKVALRSALVLGPGRGGVMEVFQRLARLGLGGTMGRGDQFVSWVHADDFCRAVEWLIEHPELEGPVNCAAPSPVPNREFMRLLRRACGVPFGLPAADWMLEIGAYLLNSETELLLKSRRVVPGRLLASGFELRYPHPAEALEDLCRAAPAVAG